MFQTPGFYKSSKAMDSGLNLIYDNALRNTYVKSGAMLNNIFLKNNLLRIAMMSKSVGELKSTVF